MRGYSTIKMEMLSSKV